jgi:hypothetical protein
MIILMLDELVLDGRFDSRIDVNQVTLFSEIVTRANDVGTKNISCVFYRYRDVVPVPNFICFK